MQQLGHYPSGVHDERTNGFSNCVVITWQASRRMCTESQMRNHPRGPRHEPLLAVCPEIPDGRLRAGPSEVQPLIPSTNQIGQNEDLPQRKRGIPFGFFNLGGRLFILRSLWFSDNSGPCFSQPLCKLQGLVYFLQELKLDSQEDMQIRISSRSQQKGTVDVHCTWMVSFA